MHYPEGWEDGSMAETKEPQATSHPSVESSLPSSAMRFRSIGSVAVLLELWTQGRCVLDQLEVEYLLSRMSELDVAIEARYRRLYT